MRMSVMLPRIRSSIFIMMRNPSIRHIKEIRSYLHSSHIIITHSRTVSKIGLLLVKEFSTEKKSGPEGAGHNSQKKEIMDADEFDDYEEPKTTGQKFAYYTTLGARLLLVVGGLVCVGITFRELFPGRMSPNALFNEAYEVARHFDDVVAITGEPTKAFGRDVGRNTEGRRNHVDSRSYTSEDDGSKRTRIRFYIQGPKGKVAAYVEVSSKMPNTEFVYLICQDIRTGKVVTIHDNRARISLEAGVSSVEGKNALNSLLGSFTGSSSK